VHFIQAPLFDFEALVAEKGNDPLVMGLEALDAEKLIATLERESWTGTRGYSVRGMCSALIAGVLYQCCSISIPRNGVALKASEAESTISYRYYRS